LQKCLVKDLETGENKIRNRICKNNCSPILEKFSGCNTVIKLPKGSVLEKILSVQMLDREGTLSTYKKLTKCDTWDDFSFVDKILEVINDEDDTCIGCLILDAPKIYENELLFLPYLISAIAKDCSLMVTFRKLRDKPSDGFTKNHVFETKFGDFLVNIGVFDLYPKPLSTIHKHYKRNKDIFKALKKFEILT